MTRAYKKPGRPPCCIEGCEKPLYARGMCTMHYTRDRNRGDVGGAEAERAERGEGSINRYGYRVINRPGHPLARAQGKVSEHRAVLFDAIGHGDHPCHWCGTVLPWLGKSAADCINVDHLDHDKLNNDRANLVVSCLDCNTKRRAFPHVPVETCRNGHPYDDENTYYGKTGRTCRACARERAQANAERNRERSRAYYAANRGRILARLREKSKESVA